MEITLPFDPIYIMLFMFGIFFGGTIESILLIRFEGKINRGFIIWRKVLQDNVQQYLLGLSENIVEEQYSHFKNTKIGYIRVEHGEALICYRTPQWSTSWPYVGYINLSLENPRIEYRCSLFLHLVVLAFFLMAVYFSSAVALLIIVGIMAMNFSIETKAIDNFLSRKVNDLK